MIRPTPDKPIKSGREPTGGEGDRGLRRECVSVWLSDLRAELAAGRDLVYAIYHSPADAVLAMPDKVLRAYMRACRVMGVAMRPDDQMPGHET